MKHDLKSEQGQVLGLVTVALIAMLAMSALIMDVGFAWYAKRQLQASVDAAALAGAQAFPNNTQATQLREGLPHQEQPDVRRDHGQRAEHRHRLPAELASARGGRTRSPSPRPAASRRRFAKVVGFDKFNFKVSSTACQPCGTKPFDVVVIIDRTGSMCDTTNSTGCIDLNGAKDGFRILLQQMDSKLDQVGLVDLPGVATATSDVCGPVAAYSNASNYDSPLESYLVDTHAHGLPARERRP